MGFVTGSSSDYPFEMFGIDHLAAIVITFFGIFYLYLYRHWFQSLPEKKVRMIEISSAIFLLLFEVAYYTWLVRMDVWSVSSGLPIELSSISVLLMIFLLIKRNRHLVEIMFMVGIAGALQAVFTPVLFYGFPHFRYIHFFLSHIAVIWVAFYFIWIRGYSITIHSIWKALLFLNILLPFIYWINLRLDGNYWFLMEKPSGGSLLDFLGPHPWYILGMQGVALLFCSVLWFIFGKKSST
ncbi:hypothetical protein BBEV_1160 [Salisediminibacterium beveridgei]|uniref:TIGR02206 family membrane protein n=2 Tax=Salisediminibacterium beveridgei TaxID=632773 RepID=A0A1D7QU89_9BACI|nr:hypothetical protein BBEV_1160 [Salisediminibacterium beveridgei]